MNNQPDNAPIPSLTEEDLKIHEMFKKFYQLETAIDKVLTEIRLEAVRAARLHAPMNSLHEGYAVLLEEVDELWDWVKANEKRRDYEAIQKETIQIAAMAIRILVDVVQPKLEAKQ